MIVLWNPPGMASSDWQQYQHGWVQLAEFWGERVRTAYLSDFQREIEWDRVNSTDGQRVIWTRPEFLPLPSFNQELALLRDEKQYIAVLKTYEALFQPGSHTPVEWKPDGQVSDALVVFQVAGQDRFLLPPFKRVDIWAWLARPNKRIFPVDQQWAGGCARGLVSRSVLGDVWASPWESGTWGQVTTGHARWCDRGAQLHAWREAVQYWLSHVRMITK